MLLFSSNSRIAPNSVDSNLLHCGYNCFRAGVISLPMHLLTPASGSFSEFMLTQELAHLHQGLTAACRLQQFSVAAKGQSTCIAAASNLMYNMPLTRQIYRDKKNDAYTAGSAEKQHMGVPP